jgi:cell division septum initiation protein DivIVA
MVTSAQKQSQDMVAAALKESHNIVASAQKQAQEALDEAARKAQDLLNKASGQSQDILRDCTQRSHDMLFEAETKAGAAMDVYQKMLDNAVSHRKQMQNILTTQMSYYDDLNVEQEVQEIVTRKLNTVRQPSGAVRPIQADKTDAAARPVQAGAATTAGAVEKGAGAADPVK